MGVLEAILALVGLITLIVLALDALDRKSSSLSPTEDLAKPYREGLHAAIHMQRVAEDLEQQIYAEAAKHRDVETEKSATQATEQP
jgi:hypothetical protein